MFLVFSIMKKEISSRGRQQSEPQARLSYLDVLGNIIRISDFEYEGKLIQTTDSVFKFKNRDVQKSIKCLMALRTMCSN